MASSSTSSSSAPRGNADARHRHGLPWALLLALAMVGAVELFLHTRDARTLIASTGDANQAQAVRDQITVAGPAEVVFVGSSMTFQGISVPVVAEGLARELGRPVGVANNALRGARVDVFEAQVRHLLRQPKRPRLIVVGISMRDLRESQLDFDRMALFWNLRDWWQALRMHGWEVTERLPQVIRNVGVEPWYRTLRHRDRLALWVGRWFVNLSEEQMPARGERPDHHTGPRRRQTLADDMREFRRRKAQMIVAYRTRLPSTPRKELTDCLARLLADAKRAGVKVLLVDVPMSEPLSQLIATAHREPDHTSEFFERDYRRAVQAEADQAGVRFVTNEDLKLQLSLTDFYDAQHLSYAGAGKFTQAIVPYVARTLSE